MAPAPRVSPANAPPTMMIHISARCPRPGTLVALVVSGAAIVSLGACSVGGESDAAAPSDDSVAGFPIAGSPAPDPVANPAMDPDPGPQTERERLEARYPIGIDTTRIADRLRPEALEAITQWSPGTAPVPYTGTVQLDVDTSWAWQLTGDVIDTSWDANVYMLDLFAQTDGSVQEGLHAQGRHVFCYFSVGTYEPWRPDRALFEDDMLGAPHAGYADERWLDISDPRIVRLMINRMDMARDVGCDGVELDNIDGYEHDTGQPNFTEANALTLVRTLANEAHARGLAMALKNAPALLPSLIDYVDLSLNESCHHFNECAPYAQMTAAGKPVFNAEYGVWVWTDDGAVQIPPGAPGYETKLDEVCRTAARFDLRTLLLPKSLDGSARYSCDDRRLP